MVETYFSDKFGWYKPNKKEYFYKEYRIWAWSWKAGKIQNFKSWWDYIISIQASFGHICRIFIKITGCLNSLLKAKNVVFNTITLVMQVVGNWISFSSLPILFHIWQLARHSFQRKSYYTSKDYVNYHWICKFFFLLNFKKKLLKFFITMWYTWIYWLEHNHLQKNLSSK